MPRLTLTLFLSLFTAPALAHHPLDGLPMSTLGDGLMSGIGHPFIGYHHLFFVVLVGIAAAFTQRPKLMPGIYIAAMLIGCSIVSYTELLPITGLMVSLSLLVLGALLLFGIRLRAPALLAIFAGFGLFHGSAFGQALAAQEASFGVAVLLGYLAGLGLIQWVLALAPGYLFREVWSIDDHRSIYPRLASAAIAGMGLLLTLEAIGAR